MHPKIALVLGSALMIASLGSPAQAAVVEKQSFSGTQAATSFSASTTIRCGRHSTAIVSATGFLAGSSSVTKQTGTPKTVSNGIFVEIDSYSNGCTGANLGFATGGIANGLTPPDRRLNSAGLNGTTLVQDPGSGVQISVKLDVVIEGIGPLNASASSTKTRTVAPVTITITNSSSANRDGVGSGTITIDGVELDPTFTSTTLSDNANSVITIEKK